jgi:hypothetical protein
MEKPIRLQHGLTAEELYEAVKRARNEVFGEDLCKGGAVHSWAFLASHYTSEKRLDKIGQLELFRKTQRLPDYQRAEDAIKRGWARWVELEFGISADQARDELKIQQFFLLYELHGATFREARQRILKLGSVPCGKSAAHGDDGFFQRLGDALDDGARKKNGEHDFNMSLLYNWLTSFWWLMPLKNVAEDMARIQGTPGMAQKFNARIRQIKSRRVEGYRGAFYSAKWNGCFYSTSPPLIDFIDPAGKPSLNQTGRRLLAV